MAEKKRSTLSRSQQKAIDEGKLVETVNSLNHSEFTERYLDSDDVTRTSEEVSHKTGRKIVVDFIYSQTLKSSIKDVLEACFNLIEQSSAADYAASEVKWSPASKRKEMVLPDMRYLVLTEELQQENWTLLSEQKPDRSVLGFVSFMTTYEDGIEVLYVYEIHLCDDLRGQGVGTLLMIMVEEIGRKIGLEKCMLTVFKSNKKAVAWYERCGYSLDDFSPGPRVLRNGTIKQPTYLILSKSFLRNQ